MNNSLVAAVVIPEIIPDAVDYVRRFEAAFTKTLAGILEAGRILVEAHARLNYGEWESLFRDHLLPISKRTANRLVSIARNKALANGSNVAHLPYSLTTLYALAQVPINTLEKAIADGFVFPEMTARDVKRLLGEKVDEPKPFNAKQNIDSIRKYLEKELKKWPASSRDTFQEEVTKVVNDICK